MATHTNTASASNRSMQTPYPRLASRSHSSAQPSVSAAPSHPRLGGKLKALSDRVHTLNAEKAPFETTFGIEIEFLLVGGVEDLPDNVYDPFMPAKMLVFDALSGLQTAPCAECGEPHDFMLPVTSPDNMPHGTFDPDGWSIDTDATVLLKHDEDRKLYDVPYLLPSMRTWGMELKSRVLTKGKDLPTTDSMTDPYHRHSITTDQEITSTLQTLHDAFNTAEGSKGARENVRLVVNATCGFHVHVGNGFTGRTFSLSTVKNLFSLYTAHERSIDSIMSTDRISGTKYAILPLNTEPGIWHGRMPGGRSYNYALSQFFIWNSFSLLHYHTQKKPYVPLSRYPFNAIQRPEIGRSASSFAPADFLNLIQNASTVQEIRDLHGDYEHRNTLNFQNLASSQGKITVEFRQHAGTIEPVEIKAWTDFATSMVEFAHSASPSQMRAHLDKVLTNPNLGPLDMLSVIGCKPATQKHYAHLLGQTDSRHDYAAVRQSQQAHIAGELQDDMLPLRLHVIDSRAAALSSAAVKAKVDVKFKLGGYGRFTSAYLDGVRPKLSAAEKARLTAGRAVQRMPDVNAILDGHENVNDDEELDNLEASDLALTPETDRPAFLPATAHDGFAAASAAEYSPQCDSAGIAAPWGPDDIPALPADAATRQPRHISWALPPQQPTRGPAALTADHEIYQNPWETNSKSPAIPIPAASPSSTIPPHKPTPASITPSPDFNTTLGDLSLAPPRTPTPVLAQPVGIPPGKPIIAPCTPHSVPSGPFSLGSPLEPTPSTRPRPASVMSRRGRFVANIDLVATERLARRVRERVEAVGAEW